MNRRAGFTLVELLVALLILSLLAMMSWRGLDAVLATRERVLDETRKWQAVAAFCTRFERDLAMASPRTVRLPGGGDAAAWIARPDGTAGPRLELSRFAAPDGIDAPRRIAYQLNATGQIELWLWSGLDATPGETPARYPVLDDVRALALDYLDAHQAWQPAWPATPGAAAMPRAVRLQIVLRSGERIVRVFAVDA
mgnify:FL=1